MIVPVVNSKALETGIDEGDLIMISAALTVNITRENILSDIEIR